MFVLIPAFLWFNSDRSFVLLHGKQQPVAGFLNSVFRYLNTKNDSVELARLPYKTIKVRWILLDLRVRSIIKTAAEKLSLMTYASHARVITGIIQANLIHLSIKMTTPHQSGAPFVGERVFQNRGVCGQAFPSFASPTPFLPPFCSHPTFRASRIRAARIAFASYAGERLQRRLPHPGIF